MDATVGSRHRPRELSERHLKAVHLLVSRPDLTQKEIAQTVGVTEVTLSTWRKWPEFQAEVAKQGQWSVDKALWQRAVENRDPMAMKLWYERYGAPPQKEDPLRQLFDMTEEDMEGIAVDAYEYVKAERAAGNQR